jgi:hypothetical protein
LLHPSSHERNDLVSIRHVRRVEMECLSCDHEPVIDREVPK